jgi:hypothetical protein
MGTDDAHVKEAGPRPSRATIPNSDPRRNDLAVQPVDVAELQRGHLAGTQTQTHHQQGESRGLDGPSPSLGHSFRAVAPPGTGRVLGAGQPRASWQTRNCVCERRRFPFQMQEAEQGAEPGDQSAWESSRCAARIPTTRTAPHPCRSAIAGRQSRRSCMAALAEEDPLPSSARGLRRCANPSCRVSKKLRAIQSIGMFTAESIGRLETNQSSVYQQ